MLITTRPVSQRELTILPYIQSAAQLYESETDDSLRTKSDSQCLRQSVSQWMLYWPQKSGKPEHACSSLSLLPVFQKKGRRLEVSIGMLLRGLEPIRVLALDVHSGIPHESWRLQSSEGYDLESALMRSS